MSLELQKSPVLNIDALLLPIEGDNPSGESLRYSGIYDEISDARRADKDVAQGDWKSELKVADFRSVIDISVPALSARSKDLQIAAWLTEALINEFGFAGLRDGFKLLSGLQENFWDTLHPEIDEGDMEGRANAVAWIETQAALAATRIPITAGPGYSFLDWEDSRRFVLPDNFETLEFEAQERIRQNIAVAEAERRATAETWSKAKTQTSRQFYEELNFLIDECWDAVKELDRVNEEKYDRNQMPGLSNLQKSLDKIHSQVKKLLEEKRAEEPDASGESGESFGAESSGSNGTGSSLGGAVQSRRDASKRLGEIAAFFQHTEPHSPVAYLVQRAVKWGNMPLENWLQDVIKDENVLFQLRQTLGLDTTTESAYETPSESADSSSEGW